MNQITNNEILPITTPKQAIEEFVGEQFIEWLMNYIVHSLQSWPELRELKGKLPKIEKLRKFMIQMYISAQAFNGGKDGEPGFLGFAIANLSEASDPEAESVLEIMGNKLNEGADGLGSMKHKKLPTKEAWVKLLKALGASEEEINKSEAKEWTRQYISELSDLYSTAEWQGVAGAFAAHERMTIEENLVLSALLEHAAQISLADREVLGDAQVPAYINNSGHILEKIVFDNENKDLVWQGATRQIETRKIFLTELIKHLEI